VASPRSPTDPPGEPKNLHPLGATADRFQVNGVAVDLLSPAAAPAFVAGFDECVAHAEAEQD
jgi:hypothetical protein